MTLSSRNKSFTNAGGQKLPSIYQEGLIMR